MGKVTGFMEYERIEEGYKPVAERLKHYKEFVVGPRRRQGQGPGGALHGLRHPVL
jgi:glutamate synthase (NADPH/NADH) small chain